MIFLSLVCFISKSSVAKNPVNYCTYIAFFICFAFLLSYCEAMDKEILDAGYVYAYICMGTAVVGALFIHNLVAKNELTF